MSDDRRTPSPTTRVLTEAAARRAGTVSDGTPRVVDGDITPRPVEAPDLARMTPTEQATAIVKTFAAHSERLDHERQQRHKLEAHGEQLARIETHLSAVLPLPQRVYESNVLIGEIAKQLGLAVARLEVLGRDQERDNVLREQSEKAWERTLRTLGALQSAADQTHSAVDQLVQRFDREQAAQDRRLDELDDTAGEHADRLTAIETERKTLTRTQKTALVGAVGAAGTTGALSHQLLDALGWIASHVSNLFR